MAGMCMNSALIWVTCRANNLNGTANYLLALYSFFELLHQHGHWLFLYTALSAQNFLPYGLAIRICFVSLFGLCAIPSSMAFTGLDRLLAIIFPTFHERLKSKFYLLTLTLVCFSLSLFQLYAFLNNNVDPELKIIGTFADFLQGDARTVVRMIAFPLYCITILSYISVGVYLINKRVPLTTNNVITNRVLRSLFIIVTVNVGGYFVIWSYWGFVAPNVSSEVTRWILCQIIAIPVNFGAAANAPILYFTSQEYRRAFQQTFPCLAKCSPIKAITNPTNNAVAPSFGLQMMPIPVSRNSLKQPAAVGLVLLKHSQLGSRNARSSQTFAGIMR